MKKHIVLGVNENPKYLYYLPLVVWAWKQFGWDIILFKTIIDKETPFYSAFDKLLIHNVPLEWNFDNIHFVNGINGYKSETLAQVSRLYASLKTENANDYLLTSDVDMLPLSDYWKPERGITTWGRDLTDYHYPICYIGMNADIWSGVMDNYDLDYNKMIKRDLDIYVPKAKNVWCIDQDIITEKLRNWTMTRKTNINRGTDKRTGYPLGRVDRSNWRLDHPQLIDAHLPHDILTNDESFRKVMQLLHHVWPSTDFKWMLEYHREFKKLL